MNKLQMAYLHMQERVLAQMERSSELAGTIPGLSEVTEQLKTFLTQLRELRQVQEWTTRGISERKSLVKEQLIDEATLVSAFFQEMSKRPNLEHLSGLFKTKTEIESMKQELLVAYSAELENVVAENAELFTELGYPDDRKASFLAISMEFRSIKHVPREAISARKQATDAIRQLMEDIRHLLEHRVDLLFKANEHNYPEPALAYFSAREVVMPASYSRSNDDSEENDSDEFIYATDDDAQNSSSTNSEETGENPEESSNNDLDDDSDELI